MVSEEKKRYSYHPLKAETLADLLEEYAQLKREYSIKE